MASACLAHLPLHSMLRLTDCLLPLDHTESALKKSVIQRLGISENELISYTIFRRGYDARKKSAIQLVYTIDVEVRDEESVLARAKLNQHNNKLTVTPDMRYHYVAHAPAVSDNDLRPIVVGFGPCGLFAALL